MKKKILFILGMVIWLPSFIILIIGSVDLIELSITQEIIVGVMFIGSLLLSNKCKPTWMKEDEKKQIEFDLKEMDLEGFKDSMEKYLEKLEIKKHYI